MNKSQLIEKLAQQADLSKTDAGRILDTLLSIMKTTVAGGDEVALKGFGTLKVSRRAARVGKIPRTGESVHIPATKVPKFVPAADFKLAVKGD